VAYIEASEQYMFDLSDYEDWAADEARAAQIFLGSMKVEFAMDLTSLPSTREMWERAVELYQSKSHSLYISILELASSIRQQDSSIDAFYRQLTNMWRQHTVSRVTVVAFTRSTTTFFASMSSSNACARSSSNFRLALLCRPWSRRSPWLRRRTFVFVVSSRLPRF
jgi:hypothetical protein